MNTAEEECVGFHNMTRGGGCRVGWIGDVNNDISKKYLLLFLLRSVTKTLAISWGYFDGA